MTLAGGWRRFVAADNPRPRAVTKGLVLGLLTNAVASHLNLVLPWHFGRFTTTCHVLAALLAMLGPVWFRRTWWAGAAGLVALYWLVLHTALAPALLRPLVVDDGTPPADVIVVLSASTWHDGPTAQSLERFIEGARLLQGGVAPRIVFTGDPPHPRNQFHRQAPELLAALGGDPRAVAPFESIGVTPMNTFTEAQSIQRMATRYGWRRILLVTSPSHTRRSKLTFARAGLTVAVHPARSTKYDLARPYDTASRLRMFQDWVYETNATLLYRLRGRL